MPFICQIPFVVALQKNDDQLKKQGIAKKDRTKEPSLHPYSHTHVQIALNLLQQFHDHHNEIRVQAIKAAAKYGEGHFLNQASKIFGGGSI